jgi:hypothetical protein
MKRQAREDQLAKRRVFKDNTGFVALPNQPVKSVSKQSLLDNPFNSTTCWELVTNTCIRSEFLPSR